MQRDKDEQREDDHVFLDFNGSEFEEHARARDNPKPRHSGAFVVEVDIDRDATLLSKDLASAFRTPRQLEVFLAHAMTDLTDHEKQRDEETNSVIVQTLYAVTDPIFTIYDPAEGFDPDGDCADEYHCDERMLFSADLLVVNHLFKADGIGMLVTQAASHGIPIISIIPEGRKLSAMYEGLPVRMWRKVAYASLGELRAMLSEAVVDVISSVRTRSRQRELVNGLIERNPGLDLCRFRVLQGITLDELSCRTGLSSNALFQIEHDPNAFLRLHHAMIWTIAQALEIEASIGSRHTSIRLPNESNASKQAFVTDSLAHLIAYVFRSRDKAAYSQREDVAVIRAWNSYMEMVCSTATREPSPVQQSFRKTVTPAEWQQRVDFFKSHIVDK